MKKFAFGEIREFDPVAVLDTRYVEFIISSSAKDRHKSVLNMKGWELDNFNANPIVGYQHQVYGQNFCYPDNPDNVLGPGRAFMEDDKLIGGITFETKDINPLAEKIFRKVLNGTLRATSVGFMEVGNGELKRVTDTEGNVIEETYYFAGQELLEFSIVNIPSNPEAVGRSLANHAEAAMGYLMHFMPETVSMKDLRDMKVQEVLDLVQGRATLDAVQRGLKEEGLKSKSLYERKLKMIVSEIENH
jgi:hypothetical protein